MSYNSDGEEQDIVPEIVDFEVLEKAKENVQPLTTGRRVTALAGLLATPAAQRESKLSSTRKKLRINVQLALEPEDDSDESADPLEAYCRLVYWTVENYPQGHSAESGLLELLEEATRVLLKDGQGGRWKSDLRYLKLWLLYASYVDRPTVIYKFLLANEVGTEWAMLYIEHAAVLERDGRKREADEVYALGIARKASPLEQLEARYADFQKRMMSNFMASSSSAAAAPPPPPVAGSSKPRQALATTSSTTTRLPSSSSSSSNSTAPNGRIQIFLDPTGEGAQAAESESPTAPGENAWTELGTRKERIRENIPAVKKMVGSTIKQAGRSKRVASGSSVGGAGSKIAVFRDPVPGDDGEDGSTTAGGGGGGSSKMMVFKDPKPSSSSSSSSKMTISKDPTPPASEVPRSSSRPLGGSSSKIAVFKDPSPGPGAGDASSGSKMTIFRDPAPPPASTSRSFAGGSSSSSKMTVFKDPLPPVDNVGGLRSSGGVTGVAAASTKKRLGNPTAGSSSSLSFTSRKVTPAAVKTTSSFVPYVDEGSVNGDHEVKVGSAATTIGGGGGGGGGVGVQPKFVPFRDETTTTTSAAANSEAVMKIKKEGLVVSSEAEALRKDPLKNYELDDVRRSALMDE